MGTFLPSKRSRLSDSWSAKGKDTPMSTANQTNFRRHIYLLMTFTRTLSSNGKQIVCLWTMEQFVKYSVILRVFAVTTYSHVGNVRFAIGLWSSWCTLLVLPFLPSSRIPPVFQNYDTARQILDFPVLDGISGSPWEQFDDFTPMIPQTALGLHQYSVLLFWPTIWKIAWASLKHLCATLRTCLSWWLDLDNYTIVLYTACQYGLLSFPLLLTTLWCPAPYTE